MMRWGSIAKFAAAVVIAAAWLTPPAARAQDGLRVLQRGAWTVEIVTNGARSACSVLTAGEAGPAMIITMTDDSDFILPVFEASADRRKLRPGDALVIVIGDFAAPAVAEVSYDEDGAQFAAYPDPDLAAEVVNAMRGGGQARLLRDGEQLMALPLAGFRAAYDEAAKTCGAG